MVPDSDDRRYACLRPGKLTLLLSRCSGQSAYFLPSICQVRMQRLQAGLEGRTEPGVAKQSSQIRLRQRMCRPPCCPIHSRMNVRG